MLVAHRDKLPRLPPSLSGSWESRAQPTLLKQEQQGFLRVQGGASEWETPKPKGNRRKKNKNLNQSKTAAKG